MRHPFQCTAVINRSPPGPDILLAACGPKLLALDFSSGKVVAEWPTTSNSNSRAETEGGERPAKKQRTGDNPAAQSTIILLKVAPDGQHAVIVTDDKVVRVLQVKPDGTLEELSQRCMPKRPCAIDVLPGSSVILCGDKFGDVYSLPLHPGDRNYHQQHTIARKDTSKPASSTFKPSASNLTVHTKRNLRALESQMSQKGFTPKKEPLAFEHQLLLGHVSMLTDLKYASRDVGSKRRGYIITTDRDEHIRISRGPPQSYVIEGFCLAHDEFVSRICLIPGTDLLLSGGGDDWLGVWNWGQSKLLSKIDLRPLVERSGCPDASGLQIAVSGLWAGQVPEKVTVVAIEKLPVLFIIAPSASDGDESGYLSDRVRVSTMLLDGCPIDVTWINDTMIVSQDVRNETEPRLLAFQFDQSSNAEDTHNPLGARRLDEGDMTGKPLTNLNSFTDDTMISARSLDDLLYSVNNLRKRRDAGDFVENGEDEDVP